MSDATITKSKLFQEDIAFADGGTGAAETGQRLTSTGSVATLTKVDATHIKYRSINQSLEGLIDYTCYTRAQIDAAITAIGSDEATIYLPPGSLTLATSLTIPANVELKPSRGFLMTIPNGLTLTVNGTLDAGMYQIFSCTGTGKVAGLDFVMPEWFGATGDGTTDDTDALDDAIAACDAGGVIKISKVYVTMGALIQKSLSFVSDSPTIYNGVTGGTIRAAGAQAYVLKFLGVYASPPTAFLQIFMRNVNIDGNDQAISDAALVMQYCNFINLERVAVQNVDGHGVRMRTCWESRINRPWINNCGTIDTGSAFYIDGPTPFDYDYGTNNLRIKDGTWSSNRGRWIDANSLANLDCCWITGNKFELDNDTTPNTSNTNVIYLGAASRTQILNNGFAGFGSTDKYQNLIYIDGDPANTSYGTPTNRVWGNHALAYNPTSGTINGLYLGTNAPTCEEGENTFFGSNGESCPNVNVSVYPQLINRTWRNQSSSLYPLVLLPDREQPGFLSIHKVSRGNYAKPFVADTNCANNSMTVLQLAAANQANPDICSSLDLRRFIGHYAKDLIIRLRMRLDAAGSVTVVVNPSSPDYQPVPVIVDSTSWAWYEFICPVSLITTTNHLLDVYHWQINTGTPKLLVDGLEFDTTEVYITTQTVGSPAIPVTGCLKPRITYIDSSGGAVNATLADATANDIGQRQIFIMIDETTSSTLTVATHETSINEVFTFDLFGATLVLEWDGAEWDTIHNFGATT